MDLKKGMFLFAFISAGLMVLFIILFYYTGIDLYESNQFLEHSQSNDFVLKLQNDFLEFKMIMYGLMIIFSICIIFILWKIEEVISSLPLTTKNQN